MRTADNINVIRRYSLPEEDMSLAGYVALIDSVNLKVPLPHSLCAISIKHHRYREGKWDVFTPRHKPESSLAGHLTFALKYEGVDLAILNALFSEIEKSEIESIVRNEPTGRYARRIWFFYEWLTKEKLNIPDLKRGNYVDALDASLQYPGQSERSQRQRVNNNLPGTINFCPLIRRTDTLEKFISDELDKKVEEVVGKVHSDVLARAAAFLLLKDSKASYAIEGEQPSHSRAERWAHALGHAGEHELTMKELLRLQKIVIADSRFVNMGWRKQGGFVGVHDRISGNPLPDHISAKWEDVAVLTEGFLATTKRLSHSDLDAVLSAAILSFGFVFIHPFEDGNGRIHRYIIHHVLAEKGFTPSGIIFPVSAVMFERIEAYKSVLESFSKQRLDLIDWKPTGRGNVEVQNETIDLYRFFDATEQAEFLYECVRETIEKTLPEEVTYLKQHDEMRSFIKDRFDMPENIVENLIGFLRQENGRLSKRARRKEFSELTDKEISDLDECYDRIFNETDY